MLTQDARRHMSPPAIFLSAASRRATCVTSSAKSPGALLVVRLAAAAPACYPPLILDRRSLSWEILINSRHSGSVALYGSWGILVVVSGRGMKSSPSKPSTSATNSTNCPKQKANAPARTIFLCGRTCQRVSQNVGSGAALSDPRPLAAVAGDHVVEVAGCRRCAG